MSSGTPDYDQANGYLDSSSWYGEPGRTILQLRHSEGSRCDYSPHAKLPCLPVSKGRRGNLKDMNEEEVKNEKKNEEALSEDCECGEIWF